MAPAPLLSPKTPTSARRSPAPPTAAAVGNPFKDSTALIEVLPPEIDVEEEMRMYESMCDSPIDSAGPQRDAAFLSARAGSTNVPASSLRRSSSRTRPESLFSHDSLSIWLAANSGKGASGAFARDVQIVGWTSVGDNKKGGAYICYDCAIHLKDGTVVHVHKRYSSFAQLDSCLRASLPPDLQPLVPTLPPKNPLSKFRAAFLDKRRRALQHWLASVLLHPDIGGCDVVRRWVTNP